MLRPTLTLLRKELRQHWLPFLLLAGLCFLAMIGIVIWLTKASQVASVFEPVRLFLMLGVPLVAAILCSHLIVAEYRARTQLFLEALPVTRLHMVLVKFGFGLGALLAMVLATLALAALAGRRHEAISPQFGINLAASAAAHACFWFTFFFTTGLLGRYRWPLLILLALTAFAVDSRTAWDISAFGPFKLIGDRFAFERETLPTRALTETLLTAAALAATSFALALVREGNVSTLLAEKMSQREKVFISVVLATAAAASSTVSSNVKRQPYRLPDATEHTVRGVTVKVAGSPAKARPLAEFLAAEMAELRDYLALADLPTVMLTPRSDLDANKFERGQLSNAEGFLVRLNYDAPDFDRHRFLAWLAPEVLNHRLHGRAAREPHRWVLDGFGEYWRHRAHPAEPLTANTNLALRALVGFGQSAPTADTLRHWFTHRERVGEGIAIGMAWSGLRTLARERGPDACRDFLRAVLGPPLPHDLRALWRDRHPTDLLLRRATGLTESQLLTAWHRELTLARSALADQLARLPQPTLELNLVATTPQTVLVRYQASFAPGRPPLELRTPKDSSRATRQPRPDKSATAPATDTLEYRLRYLQLPPFNEAIQENDLKDELHREPPAATAQHELPETFPRGGRLLIGIATFVPELGCDITSGWHRLTLAPEL